MKKKVGNIYPLLLQPVSYHSFNTAHYVVQEKERGTTKFFRAILLDDAGRTRV